MAKKLPRKAYRPRALTGGGGVPPAPHATTHENGGADEVNVTGLSGLLADPQTPTAHATSHQNGGSDEINVGGLSGLLADPQTPLAHATSHQNGGSDEINVGGLSGELADAQPVTVRKNSGANVGTRSRLNLIEGANVTLTVTDDGVDDEVDVTIASAAGGTAGPRGAPIQGEEGEEGSIGPPGRSRIGPTGLAGASGPRGHRGHPGFTGDDGDDAPVVRGKPGAAGGTGATGSPGPRGRQGVGIDGEDAEPPPVIRGRRGADGSAGANGARGLRGVPGHDAELEDAFQSQPPHDGNARRARAAFALEGAITPPTLTAAVNDYAPDGLKTAVVIRVSSNVVGGWNITGLDSTAIPNGALIIFQNVSATALTTLTNNDPASLVANRFLFSSFSGSGDAVLQLGDCLMVQRDNVAQVWRGIAKWLPPAHAGNHTGGGTDIIADYVGATGIGAGVPGLVPSCPSATRTNALLGNGNWTSISAMLDNLTTGEVQGDLIYRNATVWTFLHAGTNRQLLQTAGASADPAWGYGGEVNLVPSASFVIPTNIAMYAPDRYEIGAAINIELGANAVLEIG